MDVLLNSCELHSATSAGKAEPHLIQMRFSYLICVIEITFSADALPPETKQIASNYIECLQKGWFLSKKMHIFGLCDMTKDLIFSQ